MPVQPSDYYINAEGNFVFTEAYHLRRGYCCKNECKHCPWGYKKEHKADNQSPKKDKK